MTARLPRKFELIHRAFFWFQPRKPNRVADAASPHRSLPAVRRKTFSVLRLRATQRECAALLLDQRPGLRVAHRFAGVDAMRPREFRREPETHQLAADNCFRLHDEKLTWFRESDKEMQTRRLF